jgi:bla regulator protein blaR1
MLEGFRLPTPLLEALGWTLLHSLWQGALIAVLLFFILLFVKQSQPRYLLSCAALLLMLLFPALTFGTLYENPDVTASVENQIPPADVPVAINQTNQPVQTDELQTVSLVGRANGIAPTKPFWRVDWRRHLTMVLPYAVVLWLLGVILLSLRLLLQWLYAERFKRRHTKQASADLQYLVRMLALRLRVSRLVQLLESSLVDVPTVIGFLKPVILLPTSALTGLTMQQLESLLAHELAHIRRHDYLVNIVQSVIETLLFYHPAVWWVSGRIRIER